MTLILNGTDNSATTPAVTGTDTDTGVYYPAANQVALATNGTERMRIDSSGNVGIGTSSPSSAISVSRSTGEAVISITNAGSASSWLTLAPSSSGNAYIHNTSNVATVFTTNGSERMRIDSSGNLLVGASSQIGAEKLGVTSGTTNATQYTTIATKGGSGLYVNQQQTTSVSTSATVILANPNYCTFCLVHGSDGTNRFSDVVLMSIGTGTVNVISSLSASGTPAARTYSQSSSTFILAMASGTYTVQVSALTMNS